MKKILSLGLIGLLTFSMIGCSPKETDNTEISVAIPDNVEMTLDTSDTSNASGDMESTVSVTNTDSNIDGQDEEYYVSPTDNIAIGEVITIGDIAMFDGDKIHIISGDLIEVFEYDNKNEIDFYIGQTVQLTKNKDRNVLSSFEQEDYTISHTNMGDMITQISGKLIAIGKNSITIESKNGISKIETYEAFEGRVGDHVTAYVTSFDNKQSSIMTINESNKLKLTIVKITRSDEGIMELLLKDADGGEYAISPSYEMVEFDMSQLKINDVLTVYIKGGIMESWPMQVDTVLIRK